MTKKVDKHFVSEIDKFLDQLWDKVPESPSQAAERKEYERIGKLRDNPQEKQDDGEIWQDF